LPTIIAGGRRVPRPDVEASVRRVMAGQTSFGRFIKPIVDQLSALPEDRQRESLETLHIIRDFLDDRDLRGLDFERDDVLFMMSNRVGNIVRRPILNSWYAQRVDNAIPAKDRGEQRFKDVMIRYLNAGGWSKFVDVPGVKDWARETGVQVHIDILAVSSMVNDEMRRNPVYGVGFFKKAIEIWNADQRKYATPHIADYEAENQLARAAGEKSRFETDPLHMFNAGLKLESKLANIVYELSGKHGEDFPVLLRELTFMLVEDDPFHTGWADMLRYCKQIRRYTPPAALENPDPEFRKYESNGYYASAERALDVIHASEKPPGLILTDIELGRDQMNGIGFIERLWKEETDAGRKPMILAIYSSNPRPYQEDMERLRREGKIIGHYHKEGFDIRTLLQAVNEELKRREKP